MVPFLVGKRVDCSSNRNVLSAKRKPSTRAVLSCYRNIRSCGCRCLWELRGRRKRWVILPRYIEETRKKKHLRAPGLCALDGRVFSARTHNTGLPSIRIDSIFGYCHVELSTTMRIALTWRQATAKGKKEGFYMIFLPLHCRCISNGIHTHGGGASDWKTARRSETRAGAKRCAR